MKIKRLTRIVMISVIYTVLSLVLAPISYGNIQCRISEAMTLLAIGGLDYILGLTFGCFMTNLFGILTAADAIGVMDLFFGTLATLLGCLFTYWLRNVRFKNLPVLAALMPVISNGIIIGYELAVMFGSMSLWLIMGLEVAAGELVAVIVGLIIYNFFGDRIFNV